MTSEYWPESMLAVVTRLGQGKNECGTRIARGLARHGAPADINDLAKELLQARLDQPRSRGDDAWRIPGELAAAHGVRYGSKAPVDGLFPGDERLSHVHGRCLIGVNWNDPFSPNRAALTNRILPGLDHVISIGSLARWRTASRGPMDTTTKSGLLNLTQHMVSEGASLSMTIGILLPTGMFRPRIFRAQLALSCRESSCSGLLDSAERGKLVASPWRRHVNAASGIPLDRRGSNAMRSIVESTVGSGRMKVELHRSDCRSRSEARERRR